MYALSGFHFNRLKFLRFQNHFSLLQKYIRKIPTSLKIKFRTQYIDIYRTRMDRETPPFKMSHIKISFSRKFNNPLIRILESLLIFQLRICIEDHHASI